MTLDKSDAALMGPAPICPNAAGVNAPDEHHPKLAILRKQPVIVAKRSRASDLRSLLPPARREQCQLALALEIDELGV